MTAQRPGVQRTNAGGRLLGALGFDQTPYVEDIAAAQAYALLGIAEALGDIALSLRAMRPDPASSTPKEQ